MQKLFTYSSEKREYALTARPEISRIQRPFSMGFSGENTTLFWQQYNVLPKTPMFN
ncbi:hypothetical protein [Alteromonas macleodii]|jgi:hypothetical protein|uniref:hypothetical protein n=1 Tax=Alteromonas macleodii TaxID=28108 RepID=UPI003BF916C6